MEKQQEGDKNTTTALALDCLNTFKYPYPVLFCLTPDEGDAHNKAIT